MGPITIRIPVPRRLAAALASLLLAGPAQALETMEAIGAEKCGGPVKSFTVDFLAPETATLEARAKVMVKGAEPPQEIAILSLDGKACTNARCSLRANKGQTYRLVAESGASKLDDLCIAVGRP